MLYEWWSGFYCQIHSLNKGQWSRQFGWSFLLQVSYTSMIYVVIWMRILLIYLAISFSREWYRVSRCRFKKSFTGRFPINQEFTHLKSFQNTKFDENRFIKDAEPVPTKPLTLIFITSNRFHDQLKLDCVKPFFEKR